MRACHAAGPGSIPGQDKFPGGGFSSPVRQMSGSFRPSRSLNIIWPSLSSLIIHYGRQCPEMLTCPKTLNIHTYNGNRLILIILINKRQLCTLKQSTFRHTWVPKQCCRTCSAVAFYEGCRVCINYQLPAYQTTLS